MSILTTVNFSQQQFIRDYYVFNSYQLDQFYVYMIKKLDLINELIAYHNNKNDEQSQLTLVVIVTDVENAIYDYLNVVDDEELWETFDSLKNSNCILEYCITSNFPNLNQHFLDNPENYLESLNADACQEFLEYKKLLPNFQDFNNYKLVHKKNNKISKDLLRTFYGTLR